MAQWSLVCDVRTPMGITVLLLSAWGRTRVKYLAKHIVKLKNSKKIHCSHFTDAMSFAMHLSVQKKAEVQQTNLHLFLPVLNEEDQTKLLKVCLELIKPLISYGDRTFQAIIIFWVIFYSMAIWTTNDQRHNWDIPRWCLKNGRKL